jgi:hypothetical protein
MGGISHQIWCEIAGKDGDSEDTLWKTENEVLLATPMIPSGSGIEVLVEKNTRFYRSWENLSEPQQL